MKQLAKAVRLAFRDVAYPFRMPAGFAGDVNRTHPATIEPALINTTNPPTLYGIPAFISTAGTANAVRMVITADGSATPSAPWGFFARPFPSQQQTATTANAPASLSSSIPPVSGQVDVLRAGYIMGQMNPASAAVVKGGQVYVWAAATTGSGATLHTQGNLEQAANSTNTLALTGCFFNGPADSSGVVELSVNI